MDIPLTIGMPVDAENGRAGRLEMIIVDQDSKQPTYLVIRRSPPYFPARVVVPTKLVSEVAEGTVRLRMYKEALDAFPDYEVTVEKPVDEPGENPEQPSYVDQWPLTTPSLWLTEGAVKVPQRTVPEHTEDVRIGMTVYDAGGLALGMVQGVIVNSDTKQVTHIILWRLGVRRLVPVDLIDFTIRNDVYLTIGQDYVPGLPAEKQKA